MDNEILDYYQDHDGKKHPQTVAQAVAYKSDAYPHANNVDEALQAIACNVGGSIVASGSNDNGSYIKYADGTLECYTSISIDIPKVTAEYALFSIANAWTYPIAFIDRPIISANAVGSVDDGSFYYCTPYTIEANKEKITSLYCLRMLATLGGKSRISLRAIGRWYDQPTSEYHPTLMYSNPNLLINGDFTNPVNQQGLTTYKSSGGEKTHTIDGWYMRGITNTTLVIEEDGITINNPDNESVYLSQPFGKAFVNGIYTMSTEVLNLNGKVEYYLDGVGITKELTIGINAETYNGSPSSYSFLIHPKSSIKLKRVKLEHGQITPFYPKSYNDELLACQRYCQIFKNLDVRTMRRDGKYHYYNIILNTEMVGNTSVSISSDCHIVDYNGSGLVYAAPIVLEKVSCKGNVLTVRKLSSLNNDTVLRTNGYLKIESTF